MEFKVVKINHEFKNVVVSHKALIEADIELQKKEIIKCFSLPSLKVEGLMTVGPNTQDKTKAKEAFKGLRDLFLKINKDLPEERQMSELSMGMSDDLLVAVQEGATMVRVGTAIFGKRKKHA